MNVPYDADFEIEFDIVLGSESNSRYAALLRVGLGTEQGYMNPTIFFNNPKYGWQVIGISINDGDQEQRMFVYTGWQHSESHHVLVKAIGGVMLFYSDGELMNRAKWDGSETSDKCSTFTARQF